MTDPDDRTVRILGCRGIPASHGGFETFAERLSIYLTERGWQVVVYCQEEGKGPIIEDTWNGVDRVRIPVRGTGALSTMAFDWLAARHAAREPSPVLTLGYNTAIFSLLYRLKGIPNAMNMDGIEWKREKYGRLQRAWLWLNEWAGCRLSDHCVADHPGIRRHLQRWNADHKVSVIPYSADEPEPDASVLEPLGLERGGYYLVVARPEPENSIREIVSAFSCRKRREKLVVLGEYGPEAGDYPRSIREMAGDGVLFPGAIYDSRVVHSLRFYARAYVHGHRVGGTNPSLVEALAAGSPILAHENEFNRWVAGASAFYFTREDDCAEIFDGLEEIDEDLLHARRRASRARFSEAFTHETVLAAYESLLLDLTCRSVPGLALIPRPSIQQDAETRSLDSAVRTV